VSDKEPGCYPKSWRGERCRDVIPARAGMTRQRKRSEGKRLSLTGFSSLYFRFPSLAAGQALDFVRQGNCQFPCPQEKSMGYSKSDLNNSFLGQTSVARKQDPKHPDVGKPAQPESLAYRGFRKASATPGRSAIPLPAARYSSESRLSFITREMARAPIMAAMTIFGS
jgi:hypothetical protein